MSAPPPAGGKGSPTPSPSTPAVPAVASRAKPPVPHTRQGAGPRPRIPGIRRAAIATFLLGDAFTKKAFRLFHPDDVRSLMAEAKNLEGVTEEEVLVVLEDLVKELETGIPGVGEHGKRIEEAAVLVFGRDIIAPAQSKEVAAMSRQIHAVATDKPEVFAGTLQREHPQTIAVMLATLPSDLAAAVLRHLPSEIRSDVVRRVGKLRGVSSAALANVTEKLGREFSRPADAGPIALDGLETAVKLLRTVGAGQEQTILQEMAEVDVEMSEAIKAKLFTFEDLRFLHDRELQLILRDVDQRSLPVALKNASPEIQKRILGNISKRAAEMLAEDIGAMGPITVAQIEAAQAQIVAQVLALAAQGKVNMRPPEAP